MRAILENKQYRNGNWQILSHMSRVGLSVGIKFLTIGQANEAQHFKEIEFNKSNF